MKARALTSSGVVLVLVSLCSTSAAAAPGDFDSSFGSGFGRVRSNIFVAINWKTFGTGEVSGQPVMAMQPDGKYVIAASCKTGATFDLCVARFDADGGVDSGFGTAGVTVTDMRGTDDYVGGVGIQADGKVVVAGSCAATATSGTGADFCVVRLGANGMLDTTFASGGKVFTSLRDFDDTATGMTLQGDGKIVVAGFCAASTSTATGIEPCVARYTSAGALDTTLSGDGRIPVVRPAGVVTPTTIRKKANGLAVAADGKIVLVGSTILVGALSGGSSPDYNTDLQVIRLLPNGSPDSSFSSDGFVAESPPSGWLVGNAATIQPDGRIVVVASQVIGCSNGQTECLIVRRYNDNGTLDSTFGSSGRVTLDFSALGLGSSGFSVARQGDGKIIVSGLCYVANGLRNFCFARLRDDGSIDTSFASNGIGLATFNTPPGETSSAHTAAVQPDGKIALAGYCAPAVCIARLEGGPFGARNCSLDIDGDGLTVATVDGLIATRVMLGMSGSAVLNGITFAPHATRTEWGTNTVRDIRKHLITQCGMNLQ